MSGKSCGGVRRGRIELKNKILIVDDVELNRDILKAFLENDYQILEAENGLEALAVLQAEHDELAAILLDLVMPVMDGFRVLEELYARKLTEKIPVLVISGDNSIESEQKCFDLGIVDFIGKPFNEALVQRRIRNSVEHFAYKNQLEKKVAEQTASLTEANRILKLQALRLEKQNEELIDVLGTVVEYRNLESGEHIQRVKGYTRCLALAYAKLYPECGLTKERIDLIVSASALHDIGKIMISDSILLKPGRLTKEEFEIMKTHTTKGCELLNSISGIWNNEYYQVGYEICRHHHERFDGRGYPDALTGDEIPLSARLVSVADVYDALVNERCYKKAFPTDVAFQMILNGECGAFSPQLMEAFTLAREEFEQLAHS